MPRTRVVFFIDEERVCPLLVWLDQLPTKEPDYA